MISSHSNQNKPGFPMDCSTCSNIMANKFAWAILCSGHGSLGDFNDCCSSCHQRRRHFDKLFDQPMVTKRERQCFLGNRPHLLDLDFHLKLFAPVFLIILQSKPLNLCTAWSRTRLGSPLYAGSPVALLH